MRSAVRRRPKEPLVFAENDPANPQPKIVADIKLGETTTWLDIDTSGLVERMKEECIPNEVIAKAEIHFKKSGRFSQQFSQISGTYNPNTDKITIYPQIIQRNIGSGDATSGKGLPLGSIQPSCSKDDWMTNILVSEDMSRTLYHEVRHMSQQHTAEVGARSRNDRAKQIGKEGLKSVGIFSGLATSYTAMTEFIQFDNNLANFAFFTFAGLMASGAAKIKSYRKRPTEIDAFQAENDVTYPYPIFFRAR